ncbi:hypothetical protein KP004_15290 [Geomonas oryzisoli]|uniref:Uncharacterized protein n=1 Tax=Geomonas oryzisoli TaxID=2847992 RepID=A0ABX8J2G2_9BACT|nr:hypothetical protein [Geomonas oryzisoli]QWV92545.1 hypothetical protein KP004_15290 [Geomonas oryzisoli]
MGRQAGFWEEVRGAGYMWDVVGALVAAGLGRQDAGMQGALGALGALAVVITTS